MGMFEKATQFSHTLNCICLNEVGKERGANAKLTEFYTLTISENN